MVKLQCGSVTFDGIEAVIFDKDGTLADSQAYLRHLGQKRAHLINAQSPGTQAFLLRAFGLEDDRLHPGGLLAVGTRLENEIAAAIAVAATGRDWMEATAIARSAFLDADAALHRKADYTPLFEGALPLLKTLAAQGVRLGIVSADSPHQVQDFVARYRLESLISVAVGSEAGLSKPDPALLYAACDRLGTPPTATLVIGDSTADIQMAQAAGAAGCVGVSWGWAKSVLLEHADVVVHTLAEIYLHL
ncbi:MAG: HAD family hydrolase [Leptolyngbyaceae cyanobacterium bins.349]|nr:HAD family hydrolase [Leptolyngbyaceae cyanobacterium bins.349]